MGLPVCRRSRKRTGATWKWQIRSSQITWQNVPDNVKKRTTVYVVSTLATSQNMSQDAPVPHSRFNAMPQISCAHTKIHKLVQP